MRWFSSPRPLERAKPLFGSIAAIRAADRPGAAEAVSAAFAEMQAVQASMSFHDPASELSRLNREAAHCAMAVSPHLFSVLQAALVFAAVSQGVFDPTVAGLAVAAGDLPRPSDAPEPDPAASWRDIELEPEHRLVHFRRPLWLDLGGVAKGYAVDLACEALKARDVAQGLVQAGGDMRALGGEATPVRLDAGPDAEPGPLIELQNAALASSGRFEAGERRACCATYFDGRTHAATAPAFASVQAGDCMTADALTKVVMARGDDSGPMLEAFGASGLLFTRGGWREVAGAMRP